MRWLRVTKSGLMRYSIAVAAAVLMAAAAACTKNTSEPTSSTTTTSVAATTTSTTSTVATTSVTIFNVRGKVTSEKDGTTLQFADIEIIQGANIGKRFQGDGSGNYVMSNLSAGAFVARFWAPGYLIKDVLITLSTSDVTQDVQLTPAPPTTTTTIAPTLKANFSWSPNPCTIGPGGTNCTVDGSSSSGFTSRGFTSRGAIAKFVWNYAGKEVVNQQTVTLSFGCGDLFGTGTNVNLSVRLTVYDDAGNLDTLDQSIPVQKSGGVCP